MPNKVICPICGSSSIEETKEIRKVKEPYSEEVELEITNYACKDCGEEGDFTGRGEAEYEKALEGIKNKAAISVIDDFARKDISMAAIERALDLPQRTLTKWKNGLSSPSATGVALLKIIRTYPWILEVAQKNYDPFVAKEVFISNAVHDFYSTAKNVYEKNKVISFNLLETGIRAMSESTFVAYMAFERVRVDDNVIPGHYATTVGNRELYITKELP